MFCFPAGIRLWRTAARAAIIDAMSTPNRPPNAPRTSQVSGLQVLFASILAIGLLLGINFSTRISAGQRIQQDRNALESEIATLEVNQADLQAELEYARSDEYVASWARSDGKMVGENEVLVIPVPAGAPLPTATPVPPSVNLFEPETETVENWRLWWALFFDSEPPF